MITGEYVKLKDDFVFTVIKQRKTDVQILIRLKRSKQGLTQNTNFYWDGKVNKTIGGSPGGFSPKDESNKRPNVGLLKSRNLMKAFVTGKLKTKFLSFTKTREFNFGLFYFEIFICVLRSIPPSTNIKFDESS